MSDPAQTVRQTESMVLQKLARGRAEEWLKQSLANFKTQGVR
jgi:hypothetical protein